MNIDNAIAVGLFVFSAYAGQCKGESDKTIAAFLFSVGLVCLLWE
jgi:hypothetical protein